MKNKYVTSHLLIFVKLSLDIPFHAIDCGVTFPYKLFINNYSVTIERNPILFNCS